MFKKCLKFARMGQKLISGHFSRFLLVYCLRNLSSFLSVVFSTSFSIDFTLFIVLTL